MIHPLHYRLCVADPAAHYFDLTLSIQAPTPGPLTLRLPCWIPGSYLLREFARHIVSLRAQADGMAIAVTKTDKHSWTLDPGQARRLEVHYRVYAFDLSVRGAYLDLERGFFNGSSVFLEVAGRADEPVSVEIAAPEHPTCADWKLVTSLPRLGRAARHGFGRFCADNYAELIDHPVEMAQIDLVRFTAGGAPHEIAVSGQHRGDLKRLARDVKAVCEWQIRLFGAPPPFTRYVFLLYVGQDIYGGLEHRASTALMADRAALPAVGEDAPSKAYQDLLGLFSHEYFHAWNVKRIAPAVFTPHDLYQENYTRLLWAFEGVTSYYDDLALARSGVISAEQYLKRLSDTLTAVERTPGQYVQNLEDASFDAWIKYYRQDENSPNSLVSYYTKGALVALCLDLLIRRDTRGARSLDDVMRALWQRWLADGQGVAEAEWEAIASQISGLDLSDFFDRALRSVEPLPLAELLASVGVTLSHSSGDSQAPTLGVKTERDPLGWKIKCAYQGGPAQQAGLSGGDVLIALDGLRIHDLDAMLARYQAGEQLSVHAFRRERLLHVNVTLQARPHDHCALAFAPERVKGWLSTQG